MEKQKGGTYSEKIGMAGMQWVALITLTCVIGIIVLIYAGKPVPTELAMTAGAGMGVMGAALKTSPDTSNSLSTPIDPSPQVTIKN